MGWTATMLYKWWVTSLSRFELIIFSDLDVELLRAEQSTAHVVARWQQTWHDAVGPAGGQSRFDVSKDSVSPVNGGLWTLSRPTPALYQRGLEVLERARWNRTHGFDLYGTPKDIYSRADGALRRHLYNTRMLKKNKWDVPFGDCDQGFLFHMFFLRERIGIEGPRVNYTCLDVDLPGCPHLARHHAGARKPWELEKDNSGRVERLLASVDYASHVNTSQCAARFARFAQQAFQLPTKRRVSRLSGSARRRVNGTSSFQVAARRSPWNGFLQRVR